MNLKQKLNKRETIIFGATLLVSCLAVFKSIVMPNHQAISDIKEQINAAVVLPKMPIAPIISKEKQWLGSREVIEKAIDELAQPMHLGRIRLVNSAFSDFKTENSLTKKAVVLTLSGNFSAVGRYIEYLESLPAPLVIERLSINVDGANRNNVVTEIEGGSYASN